MRQVAAFIAVCTGTFLLAAAVSSSGCGHRATPPQPPPATQSAPAEVAKPQDISGTYALVTINGSALPYTMTHEPPGVRVTSGTFTFSADGTCGSKMAFVLPSGEAMEREVRATWTRDGAKLTMVWQGAGTTLGTIAGDTFTMDNEGQLFAYRKVK
jgi:hypothetical protein